MSEDPSFITLSDSRSFTTPQGWNSYSYALNNPVKYTDPSGAKWYDYAGAFIYEYADAFLGDLLPDINYENEDAIQASGDANSVAQAQALAEIATGITATGAGTGMMAVSATGGLITCPATEGVGCVVGGAGVAAGATVATAGVVVTTHGGMMLQTAQKKGKNLQKTKGKNQNPSKTESSVWKNFKSYRENIKTNEGKGNKREYYDWDYSHNEIEVYDNRGLHKGTMDPTTGERNYGAVKKGRNIKDKL